jgi:hypothetical protein
LKWFKLVKIKIKDVQNVGLSEKEGESLDEATTKQINIHCQKCKIIMYHNDVFYTSVLSCETRAW